jgi:hypothetical protein
MIVPILEGQAHERKGHSLTRCFARDSIDLKTLGNWIQDFCLMLSKCYSLSDACFNTFI